MFRYKFSDANIDKAIKALKNKQFKGKRPAFLNKFEGTVKGRKLFIDGKEVVRSSQVEDMVRKLVLSGKVPLSRDGLFYYLKQRFINIPRATIDRVLKGQSVIRETDARQPKTTHKKRSIHKKGILEFDLVEIKFEQLKGLVKPSDVKTTKGYFFGMVDRLTALSFYRFVPEKSYEEVTPVAKIAFKWFSKTLGVPMNKLVSVSDDGKEWDIKRYNRWGIRTKILARGAAIEAKNAQFQRALYRLAKMRITDKLSELTDNVVEILNNTQSSLTKQTPNEALNNALKKVADKYNKNRRGKGTKSAVRPRKLKKGEKVRLAIKPEKDDPFYKAYKGEQWSTKTYTILAVRGNTYKIKAPKGARFYHHDNLRLTTPADKKSETIIKAREKKTKKERTKRIDAIPVEKSASGRPRRKAAKKAIQNIKKWLHDQ